MRQLDKRFEGYPQQVMQCKLDGVSPISLAPNAEFVWSMRYVLESCHKCFLRFLSVLVAEHVRIASALISVVLCYFRQVFVGWYIIS